MIQDKHTRLLPRLRFPEFRSSEEWRITNLGEIANFLKGKFLSKSALSVDGSYPCIHYGELFTIYSEVITTINSRTNQNDNVLLSNENDVLMPTSDVTPNGLAKACCIKLDNVILGGDILVIRTDKQEICGEFLSRYIRHMEQKVLQYVTGTTVYHLYANSLKLLPLILPEPDEQKKIADCLGSLDNLIAAENSKIEELRKHKRGLMQQLFPQSGETVPKLRFPEFCDSGEWKITPLKKYVSLVKKKVGTKKCIPMSITTGVGLVSQEKKFGRNIAGNSYKNYIRISTNDFAYNKSATKEFPQGYIARYSGNKIAAVPNSIFTCFRPEISFIQPEYLDYLFQINFHGKWLEKYITVGARAHGALRVNDNDFLAMPIPIPKGLTEQKKIANCLGSLDDMIEASDQKLETLRQHKKGLMQQLFLPLGNQ